VAATDLEKRKLLTKPIWDEAELLIKQAREQVEATFDLAVMQINVMADKKIAELYAKQPDLQDERFPKPTTTKE